jgi:hypothetical protein
LWILRYYFITIAVLTTEIHCQRLECSALFQANMPHPLRAKVDGHMVYSVPLIVFMDDVSGNISKQWNKHHVIYASYANMPRKMMEKQFFLCFVTSSPHVTPMEPMKAMKDSIT